MRHRIQGYNVTQLHEIKLFPQSTTGPDKIVKLTTQELLRLSGHEHFDLNQEYEKPSHELLEQAYSVKIFFDTKPEFRQAIIDLYNNKYDNRTSDYLQSEWQTGILKKAVNKNTKPRFPEIGNETLYLDKDKNRPFTMAWTPEEVVISAEGKVIMTIQNKEWKYLLLEGGWWEYLVFKAAYDLPGKFSVHRNTIIRHKRNESEKNQIDVLVNTGNKLIFLECKSGKVTPQDINKMEVVRKLYGGFLSHTALVRYYPLDERDLKQSNLIERTHDLNIKEISFNDEERVNLERIIKKIQFALDQLVSETRMS
jgi:hypothetical protein